MSYRKTRIREGQLYVGNRVSFVVLRPSARKDWFCAVTYQRLCSTIIEERSEWYLENKVQLVR